jgi:hypothetical protein
MFWIVVLSMLLGAGLTAVVAGTFIVTKFYFEFGYWPWNQWIDEIVGERLEEESFDNEVKYVRTAVLVGHADAVVKFFRRRQIDERSRMNGPDI